VEGLTVTQCPICKEQLVGYQWEKTKTNKNWIKHPQKGWHNCPKKKFKKKTASYQKKIFGPGVPYDYEWDGDDHGYYCTNGHRIAGKLPMTDTCPVCNKSTTVMWLR
jgi:hypothetical protein